MTRGDFVSVFPNLADVCHLGVIGLAQEPGEPARLEQLVLSPMQRRHPRAKLLVAHRDRQLA